MTPPVSAAHPAARARGRHLVGLARAVGPLAAEIGGPHRSVALAALAVRGAQGRTPEAFSAAYGIAPGVVVAMERGQVSAEEIPQPLLVLTPVAAILQELQTAQEGSVA